MIKMVKSFQGERASTNAEDLKQNNLVSHYMTTKLVSFREDESMDEAMAKLVKNKVSGGPVVNEKNELIGVLSEGDCLKDIVARTYHNALQNNDQVKDHMTTNVATIDANADIFEAANKFLSMRLRRFPVLENGKLLGQISQKDVMKAVLKLKSSTW